MAVYGIRYCKACYSYGIELSPEARTIVEWAFLHCAKPPVINMPNDVKRCSICHGTGWVFERNYAPTQLPPNVRKRW